VAPHVVLLGDSIFDNAAYTKGLPDVLTHLRRRLPIGAVATLLAVDGSTTVDVMEQQLPRLPRGVTHAAVSMGGNDAILSADALATDGDRGSAYPRGTGLTVALAEASATASIPPTTRS
jgi:hypothetical protein